jgi:hypothetical protein
MAAAPQNPEPRDPIVPLAAAAAQAHELYLTFVGSGFTETQALYLVGQILVGNARQP